MAAAKGNTNAEIWTEEEAKSFLEEAVSISESEDYDFIGEVAKAQGSYKSVYSYLVDKFPSLKTLLDTLKSNCEANCFCNGKKGNITPSLAIMNLKSNHGWTDRVENTNNSTIEHKGISPIQFVSTSNDKDK